MSYGRGFEGAAYAVTKRLDITEIAKRMRVNLRNAQDLGALPAEMTFHVQIRRFAGGQAIDVTLSGMPDTWNYRQPGLPCDYPRNIPTHGGMTDEAIAAVRLADEMLNAYNRDDSDVQTDYFDVHFYGHAKLADESSQWWDAQERHVRARQQEVSAARKAAGLPTKGKDAQRAAGFAAREARAEFAQSNPRPYGGAL